MSEVLERHCHLVRSVQRAKRVRVRDPRARGTDAVEVGGQVLLIHRCSRIGCGRVLVRPIRA